MKRDIYREVTDRILAELDQGAIPWVKPWSATPGANTPCNAVTGRPYSGVNVMLLWAAREAGYRTPRFLTYKQATELGGHVKKGEHGWHVVFVKRLIVKDKDAQPGDDADTRTIPMMRDYTVFNIDQCEGLPDRIMNPPVKAPRNHDTRDEWADAFLTASGADIREGAGEAYFAPGADFISMPAFAAFKDADNFYATMFHELGHWTGHKSRIDRQFGKRFGDKSYAAEELVAELTSAFLCAEFDIDGEVRHAGYIDHWRQLLRDDSRAFFTAASNAQAAADYLRGLALAEPAEPEAIAA